MTVDQMFDQAHAAFRAERWAEAERGYRALTGLKPLEAFHNLGVLYQSTRRFAESETAFRAALEAKPDSLVTRHALAFLLLSNGDYREGWALYEARRGLPQLGIERPNPGYPEWRGEDLAGKHVLVVREQGVGDQIQFARFLPELARRGARVTYLSEPSLVTLFRSNGIDAVPAVVGERFPEADFWVLLGSLPLRLGLTLPSLCGAPYLAAQPSEGAGGGVGVKLRGSPNHNNDRFRSLSGEAAAAIEALGRDLDPSATGAADYLETAGIVAGLDLVITVDTAVAHLAGALGKPVWILLSARNTDWRWLHERSDSPWYESARLYRQDAPQRWGPVIRRVQEDLAAKVDPG